MRTITIPETATSHKVTITFHHVFRSIGGVLRHILSDESGDSYVYGKSDINPEQLQANIDAHTTAPDRDIKALVYCHIQANGFGFGGISFCYTDDSFDRRVGESKALRRAVAKALGIVGAGNMPKYVRQRIWEAWLESYKAGVKVWPMAEAATAPAPDPL